MKPAHCIPPLLALIAGVASMTFQRGSLSAMEKENAELRAKVAMRLGDGVARTDDRSRNARRPLVADPKLPLDWKRIAVRLEENSGFSMYGGFDQRFETRLTTMSREELIAAVAEIDSLNLPTKHRELLLGALLDPLMEKDPAWTLSHFIGKDGSSLSLDTAFGHWARKDLAKAVEWFDARIAEGKFASKNLSGESEQRESLETSLMSVLIFSDPAAAVRRIEALPDGQRDVFGSVSIGDGDSSQQKACVELMRKYLSEEDMADKIADHAYDVADYPLKEEGWSQVTECLQRLDATPAERIKTAENVAKRQMEDITSGDDAHLGESMDRLKKWIASEAEGADRIIGDSVAAAIDSGFDFSKASKLILEYQEQADDDSALVAFCQSDDVLTSETLEHRDEFLALANQIQDQAQREKVLARFAEIDAPITRKSIDDILESRDLNR